LATRAATGVIARSIILCPGTSQGLRIRGGAFSSGADVCMNIIDCDIFTSQICIDRERNQDLLTVAEACMLEEFEVL